MGYMRSVPTPSMSERKEWGAQQSRNQRGRDKRHRYQNARQYDPRICGLFVSKLSNIQLLNVEGIPYAGVSLHLGRAEKYVKEGEMKAIMKDGKMIAIQKM